ncbi:MAG: membrane dipeptidase [Candidatus Solibacter usitatus]|nr:membrane dipeptidase [Candidatus Solibacter usitatus]
MNRLGMVINISHASDATVEQVLDVSTSPVMATHHGLRSFNDIPRTMPDALLKKLASKGGVIGFHMGCEFHDKAFFDYRTKQAGKAFWDTREIGKKESELTIFEIDKIVKPSYPMVGIRAPEEIKLTIDDWFRVVDRAIAIAGEDHVALGTDFDGGPTLPRGMRDIRDLPMLTEAMLRRGYSEQRIRKFLGENTLRVVREVQRATAVRNP